MAAIGILGGIAAGSLLQPFLDPLTRSLGYGLNENLPTLILNMNQIVDLHHRQAITQSQYYELALKHGYTKENAKLFYYAADSLITPEQAVSLFIHDRLNLLYYYENNTTTLNQRLAAEIQTQNNFSFRAKRQGYRPSEATDLFNANRPLPTFSTILDWMAKEVFEPEIITKFKLSEEQPTELALYMGAYGVPTEESRKYWIAHWSTIGRASWDNLYQRFRSDRNTATYSDIDLAELTEAGVTWDEVKITQQDYDDYYTVLELSPYFRSRGRGAVYNPLPFSVLQQLWQYGVLPYNQMIGRLRDYGYSKRSSELILEAWQRKFPYGIKEPLRDNILRKYELRRISKLAATSQLTLAGVTSDAITFLLNQIDDKIALKKQDLIIKSITRQAYQDNLTQTEITALFTTNFPNMSVEEKTYNVGLVMDSVAAMFRRINLRIVGKALGEGSITEAQFRSWCQSRFIPESDIVIAIAAYNPSTDQTTTTEETTEETTEGSSD